MVYITDFFPDITIITFILKTFFISLCTYYTYFKVLNNKHISILTFVIVVIGSAIASVLVRSNKEFI